MKLMTDFLEGIHKIILRRTVEDARLLVLVHPLITNHNTCSMFHNPQQLNVENRNSKTVIDEIHAKSS